MRLLSFLSAIETALGIEEPAPQGGKWDNTRMINYHQGVARLALGSQHNGAPAPLGTVLLQSFKLADGTTCLKAFLKWKDNPAEPVYAIYEKPETSWDGEARAIATMWLNGLVSATESSDFSLAKTG